MQFILPLTILFSQEVSENILIFYHCEYLDICNV